MSLPGSRKRGSAFLLFSLFYLSDAQTPATAETLPMASADRPVVVSFDENGTKFLFVIFDAKNCSSPRQVGIYDSRTTSMIDGAAKALLCDNRLVLYSVFGSYERFLSRYQSGGLSYGNLNNLVPGPRLVPARTWTYANRRAALADMQDLENRSSYTAIRTAPSFGSPPTRSAPGAVTRGASASAIGTTAIAEAIALAWARVRNARQGGSVYTSIVPLLGQDLWYLSRTILNPQCTKAGTGFRCTYQERTTTSPAPNNFIAAMTFVGMKARGEHDTTITRTDEFSKVGGVWASATYESRLATPAPSYDTGSNSAEEERKRKFDDCRFNSGPRFIPCAY